MDPGKELLLSIYPGRVTAIFNLYDRLKAMGYSVQLISDGSPCIEMTENCKYISVSDDETSTTVISNIGIYTWDEPLSMVDVMDVVDVFAKTFGEK